MTLATRYTDTAFNVIIIAALHNDKHLGLRLSFDAEQV